MILIVIFLALVALLGAGLTLSQLRLGRLCAISPWWGRLSEKYATGEIFLSILLKIALLIANLALYGLLIWLFDARYERQMLALSGWAYCVGILGAYHFKENDHLKW